MTETRLRAYLPNGADQGPLPTPATLQAGFPLNLVGALQFNYPPEAPRSDLLGQPLEVAVEVSTDGGATWAEPDGGRFLYWRDGRDPVKGDAFQVECPTYIQRLAKALVHATGAGADGQREFTNATPGAILDTLLDEAQARGALTGMAWDFTATQDSTGAAWPTTWSIGYQVGTNLLAVLQSLADQGLVDYTTRGRTLRVYVADSPTGLGADKTMGANQVSLRFGRDLTEAPFRRTWEGLADTALVQGDLGAYLERTNGTALKPWGRQETFVTAGGVSDTGTLQVVGDAALEATADARTEWTYGLEFAAAVHLPFRDYVQGNWVYAAPDGAAPVRMKVRQVTLTRDADGRSAGNVVLNDKFLEQDVRTQRRIDGILNGTQGGTGTIPQPVGPDILQPGAVGSLSASTATYLDGKTVRAQVTLDWLDVTLNADGSTASDVVGYEVQRRQGTSGTWETFARADQSLLASSPYPQGQTWQFRVRAIDQSNNVGGFSPVAQVTTAQDTTGPSAPSTPTVVTDDTLVTVSWDGLKAGGGALEADTDHVQVHVGAVGFSPVEDNAATLKATFEPRASAVTLDGLTVGAQYHVRLLPVDTTSNAGNPSAAAAVTVAAPAGAGSPTPPSEVPTPSVQGTVKGLRVAWPVTSNGTGTRVEVHLSTTDGFTPTVGNAATLVATETGLSTTVLQTPDGTPLAQGVVYYVRLFAVNSAGTFGPSPQASGQLRQVDTEDVSVNAAWVGTMSVDRLTGGEAKFDAVLTGKIEAQGANGEAVGLDGDAGFYVKGAIPPGGTSEQRPTLVSFPVDGGSNVITSQLTASTMLVTGGATFRGVSGIEAAAKLVLNGNIKAPSNAPKMAASYLTSIMTFTPHPSTTYVGLCRGHDGWYTLRLVRGTYPAYDDRTVLARHAVDANDLPTGAGVDVDITASMAPETNQYGTYKHSPKGVFYDTTRSRYYVAGKSSLGWRWFVFTQAWAYVGKSPLWTPGNEVNPGGNACGWDYTNAKPLTVRNWNSGWEVATWAMDGSGIPTSTGLTTLTIQGTSSWVDSGGSVDNIMRGSFDLGADRFVILGAPSDTAAQHWYVFDTAGARDTAREWPTNGTAMRNGGAYDNVTATAANRRFYDLHPYLGYNTVHRYETGETFWTAGASKWWARYTWYDSSGTLHETSGSPAGSFTPPKRSRVTVTVDPVPTGAGGVEDPNSVRVYLGKNDAAEPATTAMYVRLTLPAGTTVGTLAPGTADGTALSAKAADFDLVTNPGAIESNSGGSYWRGNDEAKFLRLLLDSTQDASTASGNTPALRVGPPSGSHLRIDGNEVIAMAGDATPGTFLINGAGDTNVAGGDGRFRIGPAPGAYMNGLDFGRKESGTTDANSRISVNHGVEVTPTTVLVTPSTNHQLRVFSISSTTFTVEVRTSAGALVGSGATPNFFWAVIG